MRFGWRWTMWDILFATVPIYIFSLGMQESYKKIILKRRAKKRGIPVVTQGPKGLAAIKLLLTITLTRPVRMLLTEPIVTFLSLYVAFVFAVLFAFFAAFPIVFEGIYHFNTGESGLVFLGVGLGVAMAVVTGVLSDKLIYQKHHRLAIAEGRTHAAPEHRLYPAMWASVGLPIGLFWFGWSSREEVHWIVPVLGTIPFAWANLCIFVRFFGLHNCSCNICANSSQISTILYLIDVYGPLNGASAMAANGLLRYILGAVFPLFTLQSKSSSLHFSMTFLGKRLTNRTSMKSVSSAWSCVGNKHIWLHLVVFPARAMGTVQVGTGDQIEERLHKLV